MNCPNCGEKMDFDVIGIQDGFGEAYEEWYCLKCDISCKKEIIWPPGTAQKSILYEYPILW